MFTPIYRLKQVLRAIAQHEPCTLEDIRREVGMASKSTAAYYVQEGKRKRFVIYEPRKSRTIRLTKHGYIEVYGQMDGEFTVQEIVLAPLNQKPYRVRAMVRIY